VYMYVPGDSSHSTRRNGGENPTILHPHVFVISMPVTTVSYVSPTSSRSRLVRVGVSQVGYLYGMFRMVFLHEVQQTLASLLSYTVPSTADPVRF
jgi:hypothetical protein